jgi:hypothetical protein
MLLVDIGVSEENAIPILKLEETGSKLTLEVIKVRMWFSYVFDLHRMWLIRTTGKRERLNFPSALKKETAVPSKYQYQCMLQSIKSQTLHFGKSQLCKT